MNRQKSMRRVIVTIMFAMVAVFTMAQAKKPTLMVMPSAAWCKEHGFEQAFDNQGTTEWIPDYKAAVTTDKQLNAVISKINTLMADRGFPLKDLQQNIASISNISAEDRLIRGKTSGAEITESPLDRLRRMAKADIILELDWTVNTVGPKSSITYSLRALDAYSNKQVAGAEGTGNASFSAEIPVLLEEAVLQHMDNFNYQLQNYFNGLFENGREVSIMIRAWDSLEYGLESEFDGMELTEIIENWISDNTVGGRYNLTDATENFMSFEQVMIPLFNEKERAIDARAWLRGLQKHLRDQYEVDSKLATRGLGFAQLIVGEK